MKLKTKYPIQHEKAYQIQSGISGGWYGFRDLEGNGFEEHMYADGHWIWPSSNKEREYFPNKESTIAAMQKVSRFRSGFVMLWCKSEAA